MSEGFTYTAGKLPIQISAEEAALRTAEAEAASAPAVPNIDDLPVVRFPIRISLAGRKTVEKMNGELGGVTFEDGVSVKYLSHRQVNHFAASMFPVIDANTGIVISPLSENKTYLVEGKNWNQYQPVPTWCYGCEDDLPAPVVKKREPVVALADEAPVAVDDLPKVTVDDIMAVLTQLRPGHKEDFEGEMPRLARIQVLAGPGVITQEMLDAAWVAFSGRLDADKSAFAIPASSDTKGILEAVMRSKGARFLRQIAEARGITKSGRSGEDVVAALLEAGISESDARALL